MQNHGDKCNKSTITNLISFKYFTRDYFSRGSQTDVIFTNFEKAFDRVYHNSFIIKLEKIGIANPLLPWFAFFISQNLQIVKIKNYIW